jgi:hypothetical protein
MSPTFPQWGHAESSRSARARLLRSAVALLRGMLAAVSACVIPASTAHAQTPPSRRIVVRSYNTVGVPPSVLKRAQSTAQELLQEAGVDSVWRTCRTSHGWSSHSPDLCDDVVNASELIVRVVRAPGAADGRELGYSHLDPYRRQGTLATVFADRVRPLATALRIDEGTLLGRAMTHEIGHLLLGSLEHSSTGLMRGDWHTVGRRATDWYFSAPEAMRLQNALSARGPLPQLAVARSPSQASQ